MSKSDNDDQKCDKQPSVKTTKRLFAVSGNACAFPKCELPLVDVASGKVTGRICHIKGRKPGAARYDPDQPANERHAFKNLLLLCPIHHDVIDADEDAYTVERLRKMKESHEGSLKPADVADISDSSAETLIANIFIDKSMTQVTVVQTDNQTGGQNAQYIINA